MTPRSELRLLPWSGPEGKPCYLSTDDSDGHMSRLADNIEAIQLGMAAEMQEQAQEVLGDEEADLETLRSVLTDLTRALGDALRIATSRSHL